MTCFSSLVTIAERKRNEDPTLHPSLSEGQSAEDYSFEPRTKFCVQLQIACTSAATIRAEGWAATKRVKHGMNKRRPKLPPTPTWTCPHCGHVHTPATLRRLDSDTAQCQACKRPFASVPDEQKA